MPFDEYTGERIEEAILIPRPDVKCDVCGQYETGCELDHREVKLKSSYKLNLMRYGPGKCLVPTSFAQTMLDLEK